MKQLMDKDFPQSNDKLQNDPAMETETCPSFCPDKALDIEKTDFVEYIHKLEGVAGFEFHCIKCVKKALTQRIQYFADHGCKASDHSLDYIPYEEATDMELTAVFKKRMAGEELTKTEIDAYKTGLLLHCARQYAKHGMAMQIHFPCLHNTDADMCKTLGIDSGEALTRILTKLYEAKELPKTILHSLNPEDNAQLGTFLDAFQTP